jgi:hypothetical protein
MVESTYREMDETIDPFCQKKQMCEEWNDIVKGLFYGGLRYNNGEAGQVKITFGPEAKEVYTKHYRDLMKAANVLINNKEDGYIIGTEAKMSAYFPRLCQILAIMHDYQHPEITPGIVDKAHTLYRYFALNTVNIIKSLYSELDTGLSHEIKLLYDSLPATFKAKEAAEICVKINLNKRKFEYFKETKKFKELFNQDNYGVYSKK